MARKQEKNYSERVMLIYDGLHYDALVVFSWEQLSWSKAFVKKWFNIKSKGQDNHVDEIASTVRRSVCREIINQTESWITILRQTFNEIQKLLNKTNGRIIGDVMTPAPLVVQETTNLEDAARIHNCYSHPLIDEEDVDMFGDRFSTAYGLDREFGYVHIVALKLPVYQFLCPCPRLQEHMEYCINHPEEMSKLSKLKAHITEVKGIMMGNIEKVVNFFVGLFFLRLLEQLGAKMLYSIFASFCLMAALSAAKNVAEPKGKSLQDIDISLLSPA
ncbi:hypothetical protein ZIOFF_065583 [Zingiber officinale]|uniref:Uncharacterized protein n=1 Tax=Zingiber officinale TaxID=94328 RepID=A0A8J5KD95_ZINOF|nr:hypothetical protein ZIOFF_065583 [Zingiber officinale]